MTPNTRSRTNLINARLKLQKTQREVALAAEIERSHYAKIEAGARMPSVDAAHRIAKALNSSIEHLFFDE